MADASEGGALSKTAQKKLEKQRQKEAAAKEKAKKTAEEKAIARGRERDAKRKERDRKWGVERMVDGLRTGWWWRQRSTQARCTWRWEGRS